jgi:hypothetical protein
MTLLTGYELGRAGVRHIDGRTSHRMRGRVQLHHVLIGARHWEEVG